MIGMSARSQSVGVTGSPGAAKCAAEPSPIVKPRATSATSTATLAPASRFCTIRPGPSPMTWTAVRAAMVARAIIVCGENESVTTPSGMLANGVVSPAAGTNRPR